MDFLFFGDNFDDIDDLGGLAAHLQGFLNSGCYIWEEPDGERILLSGRAQVERLGPLKIEIYSQEHAPPHFHVVGPDLNASFTIDSCAHMAGGISRKQEELVVYWHAKAKDKLVAFWNKTRPLNCPVGPIQEGNEVPKEE